jgi:hypothetical protein
MLMIKDIIVKMVEKNMNMIKFKFSEVTLGKIISFRSFNILN